MLRHTYKYVICIALIISKPFIKLYNIKYIIYIKSLMLNAEANVKCGKVIDLLKMDDLFIKN